MFMQNTTPNQDPQTGVHYGVIHYNSLNPEALDDIFTQGENLSYKNALDEAKNSLKKAIEDAMEYHNKFAIENVVNAALDALEENFGDSYHEDEDIYEYSKAGYIITNSPSLCALFIIKSPYVTNCKYCSPCAPNAGDLDNPLDGGVETYCLELDWFDGENKCPYEPKELVPVGDKVERNE